MKQAVIVLGLFCALLSGILFSSFTSKTTVEYDFQQITTIESVIPAGAGRSRMIATSPTGTLEETEMKNFFSISGINFGNVRANDKATTDKISQMVNAGWTLEQVTSGVYSGTDNNSNGIFITRYLFKKVKQ
ncbi:hypothetical protein [Cytophaga hutchinsonii]|uniref:Uncharacterized protein n=1 Tax=Cytophaga hutchinsonii (strain ATCC 33406 / DSM 1761 / CIP 103989 / NBRC 15051 / NCIMB 9469 / D465) TaxID=269798 RepID=A0A6N4SMR7_CYTH3|nr:hypothetical protein [Cytophaga hutchinsonii]ABG57577.1 hypothetical protein CHU_0286 [Cytophaga hutchinsonii ATCC 33406]SFX00324.1 hypothetical protein SAMN04487930_101140 [Cytophaga hutchinsonii ATCC 33406]